MLVPERGASSTGWTAMEHTGFANDAGYFPNGERGIGFLTSNDGSLTGYIREDVWSLMLVPPPALPRRAHAALEGATAVTAPLAGTIASVRVAVGDEVEVGELLLTLEAMKMEHRITATDAGTVASVAVEPGGVVREGDVLVELA